MATESVQVTDILRDMTKQFMETEKNKILPGIFHDTRIIKFTKASPVLSGSGPQQTPGTPKPTQPTGIKFNTYQAIVKSSLQGKEIMPMELVFQTTDIKSNCGSQGAKTVDEKLTLYQTWDEEWEKSQEKQKVKELLSRVVENMRLVHDVFCYGFGCLNVKDNYIKHRIAIQIAEALTQYGRKHWDFKGNFRVETKVHSPDYCQDCEKILQNDPYLMEVVRDTYPTFSGKNITEHTLIVSINPEVPIRQVSVEATTESGEPGKGRYGHAGMLCNIIDTDGLSEEDFDSKDPSSLLVFEFSKKCLVSEWKNSPFGSLGLYAQYKDDFANIPRELR